MAYLHMLISLLISLLVSNAVTLRWDKSILFSRIVIIGLLFANFLALNNLFNKALVKGIGIYGGLFNVTTFTQSFNIFICLISAVILVLTAFSFTRIINIFKNILCKVFSFIKNRVFNLMLSLLLFILLLLPFKLLLPLLNLSYLLPIISGFYACIFIIIISFIDDKKDLFNIIQLLYTFTIAVTLGYIAL